MQSLIATEMDMKFPPIVLLKTDRKPEDAIGQEKQLWYQRPSEPYRCIELYGTVGTDCFRPCRLVPERKSGPSSEVQAASLEACSRPSKLHRKIEYVDIMQSTYKEIIGRP